jgi:hypothetical protein
MAFHVGDTVDFWRVEAFEPDHLLRSAAEMKLPGRAWIEFEVNGLLIFVGAPQATAVDTA